MSTRSIVLAATLALCACAAPSREAAMPSSAPPPVAPMAPGGETTKSAAPTPPPSTAGAAPTSTEAPSAMPPTTDSDGSIGPKPSPIPGQPPPIDDVPHAQAQFEASAQVFTEAGNDCVKMCKALASMQRSAEHLCELTKAGAAPDKKRCTDAKSKVDHARDRVLSTCGGCD